MIMKNNMRLFQTMFWSDLITTQINLEEKSLCLLRIIILKFWRKKVPLRCHCDVVASVSKAKLGNFWHILRNHTILTFLKYKCYIWSQIIWLVNVLSDNAISISDNFLFHETSSTLLKCSCSMRVRGYWILGV